MRCCPFFVADAVLMALAVAMFPISALYGAPMNYVLAVLSLAFVAFRLKTESDAARDFSDGVKRIGGLRSWESEFLSFGTLKFDYKGEEIRYSSRIEERFDSVIPVTYSLSLLNRNRQSFDIVQKAEGSGFDAYGEKRFFTAAARDISSFDRKYEIRRIRNSDGMLQIAVRLGFGAGKPPSREAKLGEMADFLEEYLEFGLVLNRKLKTGAQPRLPATGSRML